MKDFKHPLFDEIYFYEKLNSTYKKAAKLIKDQTAQGNFLVVSNVQSGGIGRSKNTWSSPPGGIWMTAALYGLSVSSSLTIYTGISIHKAICGIFPKLKDDLKIKWPNDIYLNDKKIGGILSSHLESRKYHIIGIGLNTNVLEFDEELVPGSTSLQIELGQLIDNQKLLSKFFDNFASALPEFVEGNLNIKYFNQNSLLKGSQIELDTDYDVFRGEAKGIDKNGALLIELKPGMIQPFYAGSVIGWIK